MILATMKLRDMTRFVILGYPGLMATMNVSLPDALKTFVDEHVTAHHYTSASEYVRELLRREEQQQRLRESILEGARSPVVAEYNEEHRARLTDLARGQHP